MQSNATPLPPELTKNPDGQPQFARGETPAFLHADEAAFIPAEQAKSFTDQLADMQKGLDVADPELKAAMEAREAKFFTPTETSVPVLNEDGSIEGLANPSAEASPADPGTIRQIGETNFFLHEASNGYQQIVVGRKGPGRLSGETVATLKTAQEMINEHNAAQGHPTVDVERMILSLGMQAMRQRQFSSQAIGKLPANHPFEIKRRLKEKGINPNSRVFRRLYRKEVEKGLKSAR